MNKYKWIIGDIHGCFDTLMLLLQQLPDEANSSNIIFLGDLVDRGPKSFEVVDFIKSGNYQCVVGNHEQMMIQGLYESSIGIYDDMYSTWVGNGGDKCLESYWKNSRKVLNEHIKWMNSLPLYLTFEFQEGIKDLLVTHAPSVDYFETLLKYQEKLMLPWGVLTQRDREVYNINVNNYYNNITWSRIIPQKGSEKYFGVSGHNVWNKMPEADSITKCIITDKFGSIDTGSCFEAEGFGILTCLEYPSMKLYQQKLVDKI